LLVFLAAQATGGMKPAHIDLAVVLELIHLATLVHDDIMDGADLRRGRPTANAKWGNAITVLLGDALFAHALMLSTNFEDKEVIRKIAHSANSVCSGEIIQTQRRFDTQLSIEEYFRIIRMKTATLFESATELAARLNSSDPAVVEALRVYGERLGTAYQVYDDCLDIAGNEATALKSLGTDFAKGKLTLPLLKTLEDSDAASRAEIEAFVLRADPKDSPEMRQLVLTNGSFEASIAAGTDLIDEAAEALQILAPSEALGRLEDLLEGVRGLISSFAFDKMPSSPLSSNGSCQSTFR
jgi:octaprenyl-diphosphate synthase